MSPNGEMVATLSADETLRFWKLFEKIEENDIDIDVGVNKIFRKSKVGIDTETKEL